MAKGLDDEEIEVLAKEYDVDSRDICRLCGKVTQVTIFRGEGYCSDEHRKILFGDDPSPYPFVGPGNTGAT